MSFIKQFKRVNSMDVKPISAGDAYNSDNDNPAITAGIKLEEGTATMGAPPPVGKVEPIYTDGELAQDALDLINIFMPEKNMLDARETKALESQLQRLAVKRNLKTIMPEIGIPLVVGAIVLRRARKKVSVKQKFMFCIGWIKRRVFKMKVPPHLVNTPMEKGDVEPPEQPISRRAQSIADFASAPEKDTE